jgi:integrase
MTLTKFYSAEYLPLRLVGKSATTLQTYGAVLRCWAHFSTADVSQIDSRLLAGWQAWLLPGHSPATVNSYVRHIRAILNYAASEEVGILARPPTIRMLREPRRSPLALTVEEFAAVLRTAEREPNAPLWRAMLLTAWESGMRLRSLLSLRPIDVLFPQSGLYCQAEGMKNAIAQWFPLQEETLAAIRGIYSLENNRLFNFRCKAGQVSRTLRRILDTSGIFAPHGSGMCFHRLRRSRASYVKLMGGDATAALGHSRPEVTARYLDARIVGAAAQPKMPMPRF